MVPSCIETSSVNPENLSMDHGGLGFGPEVMQNPAQSQQIDSKKAMGLRGSVRLQVPMFPLYRFKFERERANAQAMDVTEILILLLVASLCLLGCRHDKFSPPTRMT